MKKFMFTNLKRTSDGWIDATRTFSLGSFASNIYSLLLSARAVMMMVMLMGTISYLLAATFYVTKSANWSDNTQSGPWKAQGCTSNDIVIIGSNVTLTVDIANAVCASISLGTSNASSKGKGTLSFSGTNSTLTVSGNVTLGVTGTTYSGTLNMNTSTTPKLACTNIIVNTLSSGSNAYNAGGTVELTATNTLPTTLITTFNNLTISSGITTLGTNTTVSGNFIVAPTSGITVPTGITLTNNGTITLQSDATGTATLLNNGAINGTGTCNVQQFLTGANNGTAPNGRFWYVSSPVTGATSNTFDAAAAMNKLWYYSEPTHAYAPEITDNTTALTVGLGYVARLGSDATATFAGSSFNNGDQTFSLTRTGTTHAKRGYNLVGNPYPSSLDWNVATKTNLLPTMWYRTLSTNTIMVFDTYNASSGEGTNNSGCGAVTRYIPPMQAFWVKVDPDGNTGTLGFTNAMRSHQSGNKLRSAEAVQQQVLRLQVSNGTNIDEAIIAFNPNASDGFDAYDSPKMTNDLPQVPEIYTFAGNEQVAINGMNHIDPSKEMELGFKTGESNSFTIKASEVKNFDLYTKIILIDKLQNTTLDITNGAAYSFTSGSTNTTSRFAISFSQIVMNAEQSSGNQSISIFKNADGLISVNIQGKENPNGTIVISGIMGQKILTAAINGESTTINTNLKSGIYLVTVNIDNKQTSQKVVID